MDKLDKNNDLILGELLADLSPEELEPRLELQVFFDPVGPTTDECNINNESGAQNIVVDTRCNNNNK